MKKILTLTVAVILAALFVSCDNGMTYVADAYVVDITLYPVEGTQYDTEIELDYDVTYSDGKVVPLSKYVEPTNTTECVGSYYTSTYSVTMEDVTSNSIDVKFAFVDSYTFSDWDFDYNFGNKVYTETISDVPVTFDFTAKYSDGTVYESETVETTVDITGYDYGTTTTDTEVSVTYKGVTGTTSVTVAAEDWRLVGEWNGTGSDVWTFEADGSNWSTDNGYLTKIDEPTCSDTLYFISEDGNTLYIDTEGWYASMGLSGCLILTK